jgi:hypothetical protein
VLEQGPGKDLDAFLEALGQLEAANTFLSRHTQLASCTAALAAAQGTFDRALEQCGADFKATLAAGARAAMPSAAAFAKMVKAMPLGENLLLLAGWLLPDGASRAAGTWCVAALLYWPQSLCLLPWRLRLWYPEPCTSTTTQAHHNMVLTYLPPAVLALLPAARTCCPAPALWCPDTAEVGAGPQALPAALLPKLGRMARLMEDSGYHPAQAAYVASRNSVLQQVRASGGRGQGARGGGGLIAMYSRVNGQRRPAHLGSYSHIQVLRAAAALKHACCPMLLLLRTYSYAPAQPAVVACSCWVVSVGRCRPWPACRRCRVTSWSGWWPGGRCSSRDWRWRWSGVERGGGGGTGAGGKQGPGAARKG